MRDLFRNLIRWVTVDRAGAQLQLRHFADNITARVDYLEPQGLHFAPPVGAQGLAVAPGGVASELVSVAVTGAQPGAALDPGEGGLHLLGVFKVFLSADGKLHLGQETTTDWVALASKVDAEFAAVKADITALRTAYNSHTHAYTAPSGAAITATPSTVAPAPHNPASVASTNVGAS